MLGEMFISLLVALAVLAATSTVPLDEQTNDLYLEVAPHMRSNARKYFPSDQHFLKTVKEFRNDFHKNEKKVRKPTTFIVKVGEDCGPSCHEHLAQKFGKHRYERFHDQFVIVTGVVGDFEDLRSTNHGLHFEFAPMHPEMKMGEGLRELFKLKGNACKLHRIVDQDSEDVIMQTAKVRFEMHKLNDVDLDSFRRFVGKLEQQYSADGITVDISYPKEGSSEKVYGAIGINDCRKFQELSRLIATRNEILWVDRYYPAYLHNRWSKGLCDSGFAKMAPLDKANFTGKGEVVGISDTGIDMYNCFFYDPNVPNLQFQTSDTLVLNTEHRKVIQYYAYADNQDDAEAHGTHVSGTVAGVSYKNYGDFKKFSGMVSDAKIAFFDIGDDSSSIEKASLKTPSNLNTQMFQQMYKAGARIFSNSWGTSSSDYDDKAIQVDTFMWNYPDALVLFSAGNSGASKVSSLVAKSVGSPSTNKNGVSVGASLNDQLSWKAIVGSRATEKIGKDSVAYFSSNGPTTDNRMKPDILAPGFYVYSAKGSNESTAPYCAAKLLSGTSMACPTAAGFATKIRQYFLHGHYPSGMANATDAFTPSGALVKAMLIHSGQQMSYRVMSDLSATDLTEYPSNTQGFGRIQLSKVLNFGESTKYPSLSLYVVGASSDDFNVGDKEVYASLTNSVKTWVRTIQSDSKGSPIRATLCYTDYPGSSVTSSSGNAIVHDLALTIVGPSTYTPYRVSPATRNSNAQVIDIPNPGVSTTYQVIVELKNTLVPQATAQPFALVVSGVITYLNVTNTEDDDGSDPEYYKSTSYISAGALNYIVALSIITFFLIFLVYYFRRITSKRDSILLDPKNFESSAGGYDFEDEEVVKKSSMFSFGKKKAAKKTAANSRR